MQERHLCFGSGVLSIWLRHHLENFKKRLKALEDKVAKGGIILSDAQVAALEKKKHDDEACGEIETAYPGYLGTAADILNDKVLPYFEDYQLPMLRILTDRGKEYCGRVDHHNYQLYLAINDIEHTKTKSMSPQTNGICERFHKTIFNEFYQVTFRKSCIQPWRIYKKT